MTNSDGENKNSLSTLMIGLWVGEWKRKEFFIAWVQRYERERYLKGSPPGGKGGGDNKERKEKYYET